MTPAEAAALMTYASQLDGRIQVNEASSELWAYALQHVTAEQGKWCVREHYASDVDGGPPRTIAPGMVRARAMTLRHAAEGKRQAIAIAQERKALEGQPDPIADEMARTGKTRFQIMMDEYNASMKTPGDAA